MIHNEEEYRIALDRLDTLWKCKKGSPEAQEFEKLCDEIEEYEKIYYPMD